MSPFWNRDHPDGSSMETRRRQMVNQQLERRGIDDERVLEAFRRVPREKFVRESDRSRAYDDRALPTDRGQTISQPYMVAQMTQDLSVEPGNRVLEVGTGSGYQAAILCEMSATVYGIEYHEELVGPARRVLDELGYGDRVHLRSGDGGKGWPEEAPFDRILVTAGAPSVPDPLKEQLTVGGILVIPVGSRRAQTLTTVRRTDRDSWETSRSISCVFVPLVGDEGWQDD